MYVEEGYKQHKMSKRIIHDKSYNRKIRGWLRDLNDGTYERPTDRTVGRKSESVNVHDP